MTVTKDNIAAAMVLADAWAPALSHSFDMGYECGFRKGRIVGRGEEREAWNQIIGVYAGITDHPTRVAIEAAQAEPIRLCGRPGCGGNCSADIRIAAIERNRIKYGCDDFPGFEVAA